MTVDTQTMNHVDHVQITAAIRGCEKKTSGEIFAVLARQSDDYFYVSGFFAALWSLMTGLVLAVVASVWKLPFDILSLAGAQAATMVVFMGVFWWFPQTRLFFVPRSIAYKRASSNAIRQFLAHGIHNTDGRSGILIFVSLAERYAEIIADSGIDERVDQSVWDNMVAGLVNNAAQGTLTSGYVEVIEKAGVLLAAEFPPVKGKRNELDDKLVEL